MTVDLDDFPETFLALVANYLWPGTDPQTVREELTKVIGIAAPRLDQETAVALARKIVGAQEAPARLAALESLTALVAREVVAERLGGSAIPPESRAWLRRNVTAATRHARRVQAIWRTEAGKPVADDPAFHAHAVASAKAGETINPVPGAAPTTPPTPGMEATMKLTEVRDAILTRLAINPAGLPPVLRSQNGQQAYVDAVVQGVVVQQFGRGSDAELAREEAERAFLWASAATGLMLLDGHYNPTDSRFYAHLQRILIELGGSADERGQIAIDGHNLRMTAPDPTKDQRITIYGKVLKILDVQVSGTMDITTAGSLAVGPAIFLQGLAVVGRRASDRFADHQMNPVVLREMVRSGYSNYAAGLGGGGAGGGGGVASVELPPLNDAGGGNDEIEPDNVRAVSTIYVTFQLEFALKAASRILDLFVAGLLPISAADGSARELDDLYWDQDDLLDEGTRMSVYSRVIGAGGGHIAFDIQPNTEFNNLLLRVVSAVSEYEREQSALVHFDNAAGGRRFQSTSGEFVRKAVRDFAANASLRGWAGTAFTAERMARHVNRVMRVLSLPSVRRALGVETPWQAVERISQREFGITVNTVLQRTLAAETQTIMGIIADHHTVWSQSTGRPLFPEKTSEDSDLSVETTRRLMVACQHFRAVAGVGDATLASYAAPAVAQPMPSLPDMSGFGGTGGGMPSLNTGGMGQLRDMVANGQAPSLEQLRAMLPGF